MNTNPSKRYIKSYKLFADANGVITNLDGEILPTYEIGDFLHIQVNNDINKTHIPVHYIIATAFLGKAVAGSLIIVHKNGNFTDNSLSNLEWSKYNNVHANKEIIALRRTLDILKNKYNETLDPGLFFPTDGYQCPITIQEIGCQIKYSEKYHCYASIDGRIFKKKGSNAYVLKNNRCNQGSLYVRVGQKEVTVSKVIMDAFDDEYRKKPGYYNIVYKDGDATHPQYENLALIPSNNPVSLHNGNLPDLHDLKKIPSENLYIGRNGSAWKKIGGKLVIAKGGLRKSHLYMHLGNNQKKSVAPLAELVATFFIDGFDKNIHRIEFKDGNTLNCAVDNLRITLKGSVAKAIQSSARAVYPLAKDSECIPANASRHRNVFAPTTFLAASGLILTYAFLIAVLVFSRGGQ